MQHAIAAASVTVERSTRARASGLRRWRVRVGWTAVCLSVIVASVYGWWGIVQNFTMGWYEETAVANVLLMFVYLSPLAATIALGLCAIRFPDAAFGGHALVAASLCAWLFSRYWSGGGLPIDHRIVTAALLIAIGLLYAFGRPHPLRSASAALVLVPLAVTVGAGTGPALRALARTDDGVRTARLVEGNGVTLLWAPEGPGWPRAPVTWHEATRIAAHLSADGGTLAAGAVNAWRLPTIDEVVRSLTAGQQPAGGVWQAGSATAQYARAPEKESPLWRVRSPIIYWWTASEPDAAHAYAVCFTGRVVTSPKNSRFRGRAFRAVRNAISNQGGAYDR